MTTQTLNEEILELLETEPYEDEQKALAAAKFLFKEHRFELGMQLLLVNQLRTVLTRVKSYN